MKYFNAVNKEFQGVFHFLIHKLNQIPNVETNGELIDSTILNDFLINPKSGETAINVGNSKPNSYVIIDLKYYKLIPTHYQIQTMINYSPPTKWSLLGSNDKTQYFDINSPPENNSLCSNGPIEHKELCSDRKTSTFQVPETNQIGPFRYFQFKVLKNRAPGYYDLRLGGFELYGTLYSLNEHLFCYCSYKKTFILNKFSKVLINIILFK